MSMPSIFRSTGLSSLGGACVTCSVPNTSIRVSRALYSMHRRSATPSMCFHTGSLAGGAHPGSALSNGLAALSQPLKLRLCLHPDASGLRDYGGSVVLVDPLASLTAVEEFLWPRVGQAARRTPQQREPRSEPGPRRGDPAASAASPRRTVRCGWGCRVPHPHAVTTSLARACVRKRSSKGGRAPPPSSRSRRRPHQVRDRPVRVHCHTHRCCAPQSGPPAVADRAPRRAPPRPRARRTRALAACAA